MDQNKRFDNWILFRKWKIVDAEFFVGGIIFVVTENYEFEGWDKSIWYFFFGISDYREYDGRNKINTSPKNSSKWIKSIRLRPRLEIQTWICAQKWVSTSRKFNTNRAFWHYVNVDITERYDAADIISKNISIFCLWII